MGEHVQDTFNILPPQQRKDDRVLKRQLIEETYGMLTDSGVWYATLMNRKKELTETCKLHARHTKARREVEYPSIHLNENNTLEMLLFVDCQQISNCIWALLNLLAQVNYYKPQLILNRYAKNINNLILLFQVQPKSLKLTFLANHHICLLMILATQPGLT